MKLVIVNSGEIDQSRDANGLAHQYYDLLTKHSTPASVDGALKALYHDGDLLLLVNDNHRVVAGATLDTRSPMLLSHPYKSELFPARQTNGADIRAGYITQLVAEPKASGDTLLPGVELQKHIAKAFKDKTLGTTRPINVIAAHVVGDNTLPLYEAIKDIDLKVAVRDDLGRVSSNGYSYFVSATNDPAIELVPASAKNHVVPFDRLRDAAHEVLLRFKADRPKGPRKPGMPPVEGERTQVVRS